MRQTEIHLTEEDRMALKAFCSRGQHRARVEFHDTQKHASWLKMADIEIGIMDRQCIGGRLPGEAILRLEGVYSRFFVTVYGVSVGRHSMSSSFFP